MAFMPYLGSHTRSTDPYFCHVLFLRNVPLNTACTKGIRGREIRFCFSKAVDTFILKDFVDTF